MKPFVFVMMVSSLAVSLLTAQEPARVGPKHYKVAAAEAPTHSVTPDGRFRLYAEEVAGGGDHLFLRDLTTGETRRLTKGPGTAGDAIMSPDGRLIAYEWATPAYEWAAEDRLIELRIVGIDGSGPRVLYSNRDVLLFNGARLNLQLHPRFWFTIGRRTGNTWRRRSTRKTSPSWSCSQLQTPPCECSGGKGSRH